MKFLQILLEDLTVTNKKFQFEKGNIFEASNICEQIFLRFSNLLLKESNHSFNIDERLKLLDYDKKAKTASFDRLGF